MWKDFSSLFLCYIITSCVKLLLFPTYFSTDFDVHRNWLAITHNLPVCSWYYESTSRHTLDYPPLFAFFQYVLSQSYSLLLPSTLASPLLEIRPDGDLGSMGHMERYGLATVFLHRLSVVVSDFLLLVALWCYFPERKNLFSRVFMYCLPPLIILDHIHFQYNGFLFSFLIFSLYFIKKEKYVLGGSFFAILLCFKHMFTYVAPAYFTFLLLYFVFQLHKQRKFQIDLPLLGRLAKLGTSVLAIALFSFAPFVICSGDVVGNVKQILSRLFPFERGLTHAYWAPNFWAFYNIVDKVLSKVLKIRCENASLTGGKVGLDQGSHCVLPSIQPLTTHILSFSTSFILCVLISLSAVYRLSKVERAKKKKKKRALNENPHQVLLLCLVHSAYAFFAFSWHVHEKAVVTILYPFTILFLLSPASYMREYCILSLTALFSLFPLLYRTDELAVKYVLFVLFALVLGAVAKQKGKGVKFYFFEWMYLASIPVVEFYAQFVHYFVFGDDEKFQFLPLVVYTLFCGVGVAYVWILLIIKIFITKTL